MNLMEEVDDDIPVGRVLSRREVLMLLGGTSLVGVFSLAGCSGSGNSGTIATTTAATPTPSASASATPTALNCVATPQITEGPYWVDEMLNRSDVRTDPTTNVAQAGTPLVLNLFVASVNGTCAPLYGATVDIWHSNAAGQYSDETANSTQGQKWLRGYQTTDTNGAVQFTTIYPGWYAGRTVHIHLRVRLTSGGTSYNFTTQLFFDDAVTDTVVAQSPYNTRGTRTTRNSNDNLYQSQMQTALTQTSGGYAGAFVIGLTV